MGEKLGVRKYFFKKIVMKKIFGFILIGLIINSCSFIDSNEVVDEVMDKVEQKYIPKLHYGINIDSLNVFKGKIKNNEFLSNLLLPYGVSYQQIHQLKEKSKDIFDLRKIAAGKNYSIIFKEDSGKSLATHFIYEANHIEYVVFQFIDSLNVYKATKKTSLKQKQTSGVIHSSLYESIQKSGSDPLLALEMANIYAWSIDFYRIQKNDSFKVIYDQLLVENKPIKIDKIKAVIFYHNGREFQAYRYTENDVTEYFDETGKNLRKAFLQSPLKFGVLTSGYTLKRFHPVQKVNKPHYGTDYAAPTGTPILATGDGKVIESAFKKYNGNYVKIKHNGIYTTQYLHMSKRAVKSGDFVKQGEVIGYVGSTGLATGPHVCYRFWKNNSQVDHRREEIPSAEPVKDMVAFQKSITTYQQLLK